MALLNSGEQDIKTESNTPVTSAWRAATPLLSIASRDLIVFPVNGADESLAG